MDTNVRFHPTLGLVAVVVLHAVLLAGVFVGLHRSPEPAQPQIVLPTHQPGHNFGPSVGQYPADRSHVPAHPKLDEMKQAATSEPQALASGVSRQTVDGLKTQCSTGNCHPAASMTANGQSTASALAAQLGARIYTQHLADGQSVYASLPAGKVWAVTGIGQTQAYAGPNRWIALTADMQRGLATPNAVNPLTPPSMQPPLPESAVPTIPAPTSKPVAPKQTGRKHQLALFLDGSARSLELQRWFHENPTLRDLSANCETQTYTAGNALYRARYADIVPVSQFPAVLLLAPDGGHIHATGGSMLPSDAASLLSDLKQAVALARSVQSVESIASANSGALRERGYNWDTAVQQQSQQPFQISNPNCPDGNCPPTDSTWLPRRPGGDGGLLPLLGPAVDSRNALFWLGGTEVISFALIVIIGLLIAVIIWKRM